MTFQTEKYQATMALEARLMFDAAAAGAVVEAVHSDPAAVPEASHAAALTEAAQHLVAAPAVAEPDKTVAPAEAAVAAVSAPQAEAARHEIVFIDTGVHDWQTLRDGVTAGAEVVLLDPAQDGLAQIDAALAGRHDLDAIHIISHGFEGGIVLGGQRLDAAALNNQAERLAAIGAALGAQGDILLYGCDVASDAGQAFVSRLATLTGADVAASTNDTGAAGRGGDWVLERNVGSVETGDALTQAATAQWDGLLAPTVLAAGDIAVIGMDATDAAAAQRWAFVVLTPISAGTTVHFTDAGISNTGTFAVSALFDGHMSWTLASDVAAGTVFVVTTSTGGTATMRDLSSNVISGVSGTVGGTLFAFNTVGDQILVYQGTAGTTAGATFIYGLNTSQYGLNGGTGQWATVGSSNQYLSYRPAGLTDGTSAAVLTTNVNTTSAGTDGAGAVYGFDNMRYGGITSGSKAALLAAIGNAANWRGDNATAYNFASVLSNFTVASPPTLVSATLADTALKAGETSLVTFVFSQAVSGFDSSDLSVPNGSLSTPSSSDGGITWTGTFTPTADISDTTNVITVNLTGVANVSDSAAGSGSSASGNFTIDTLAPAISAVSSTASDGVYVVGDLIDITVTFNDSVTVTGTPQLTLETGSTDRVMNYLSGSGTNTLTFRYTVQAGDSSADLDYLSTGALAANGGTVRDASGNDATLTLASPGAAGSLGANKALVIDQVPTLGNLHGDSVAWAGVGSTVLLDAGSAATLGDADLAPLNSGNGDWSGASLTVQRSGTAVSSDSFGFNTSGALFSVSGGNLQSGGLTFATYTHSGGVLTITATSSGTLATTALMQDVANRISYRNDTPAGNATVRFTLSDGSAAATADVTVSSDTIYVTNTTDTASADLSDGVSFSEAVTIANSQAGTQTLVLDSAFANSTLTLAGNLAVSDSLVIDADAASGLTLAGSTLTVAAGQSLSFNNGAGDTLTVASSLADGGSTSAITKTGTGTLTLSGSNSYSGTTTVSAGTLAVASDGNLGGGTLTLAAGSTLQVTGDTDLDNTITLGGAATVQVDAAVIVSGAIGGSGSLAKTGSGTLTLTSTGSSYSGGTTLAAGTLSVQNAAAVGSGAITLGGGILEIDAASSQVFGNDMVLNANSWLLLTEGTTASFNGAISGGTALFVRGVAGGTSEAATFGNAGNAAGWSGDLQVTDATVEVADDDRLGAGAITLNDGSTLQVDSAGSVDNDLAIAGAATVYANAGALVLSGGVSGSGALTTGGAASTSVTLSGSNSHSGSIAVTSGTLIASGGAAIGDASALTLASGTTLELSADEAIGSLGGSGSVVLGAHALTVGGDNSSTSYAGALSGSGSLIKTGSGWFTLTGDNSHTGATIVTAGTLESDRVGGALADSSALSVATGATVMVREDDTVGSITGAGTLTINGGTLTVGGDGSSTTFSGVIDDNNMGGSLTKAGAGTLTLSGSNSYTGTTSVTAGTLAVATDANLGTGEIALNGGTLSVTDYTDLDNSIVLGSAGGGLASSTMSGVVVSGVISGTGPLTTGGSGLLMLTTANTYSGATTVASGTLAVLNDQSLGTTAGATSVADGATLWVWEAHTVAEALTLGGTGANNNGFNSALAVQDGSTLTGAITLAADTTVGADGAVTLSGDIGGAYGLTKGMGGTLTLSGSNSHTTTTVAEGTLVIAGDANLGSDAVSLATNSTLQVTGASTLDNALALSGAATVQADAAVTLSGVLSGSGDLSKTGSGTLTLAGTNSHSGAVTVSAGGLTLQGGSSLGDSSAVTVGSGSTLTLGLGAETIGSLAGAGNVALGYRLTLGGDNTTTSFSGVISGSGNGITKAGTGSFTLSGANTYTGATTVSAGTLVLSGGSAISDSSAVTVASGATVSLGASETVGSLAGAGNVSLGSNTLSAGGDNTSTSYSGVLSGSGALTKLGSGTMTLSATNTYIGDTTVSAGTLALSGGSALNDIGGVTVASGATLSLAAAETIGTLAGAGSVALGGNLTLSRSANTTVSGAISGSGGLVKNANGTLTLSGTNTYTGATTVNAGSVVLSGGAALADTSAVTVATGAALRVDGSETIGSVAGAGTLTLNGGTLTAGGDNSSTTFSGTVNEIDPGALTKAGTGTLTLSGANTLSGDLTVAAGTLAVQAIGSVGTGTLRLDDGSTAVFNTGTATLNNNLHLTGTGTLRTADSLTVAGDVSGDNLRLDGSGEVRLSSGGNSYAGTTTVAAGQLTLGAAQALGQSQQVVLGDGAALGFIADTTLTQAIDINAGIFRVADGVSATLQGVVSGSNGLRKEWSGTLRLAGANTYTGGTVVADGGTLVAAHATALGGDTDATYVEDGSVLSIADGITVTGEQLVISGAGTGAGALIGGSNSAVAGAITLSGDTSVGAGSGASFTLSGVISDGSNSFALTKVGAGVLALLGSNSFDGGLGIAAGTLSVNADAALGSGAITLAGGTLGVTGVTTIDNALAVTAASGLNVSTGVEATLSGTLSGSAALDKQGAGTLTLTADNSTFTGTATLSAGAISIGQASHLGNASVNLVSGTLEVTGADVTLANALVLSGNATLSNDLAVTLSGDIAGTGSLTKAGTGTLTLSGSNTYTGDTNVSAGTLSVTGSLSGSTNVDTGATLAGTGTVGNVTMYGGTLAPGVAGVNNGVGTLTVNGDLLLASGAVLAMDVRGTTAGTDHDQLVVDGTVDLNSGTLSVALGYTPNFEDHYTLIANDASDAVSNTFDGLAEGSTLSAGGVVFTASYAGDTGNDFTLSAPANTTPVISGLDGQSVAWAGAGNTVLLDGSGIATLSDTENDAASWNGASLTLQRTGTALSADVFGFNEVGFSVSGSALQSGGLTFATFTHSGGVLTVNFTGSGTDATNALVQAVVRGISYRNDTPAADATMRLTLSDGHTASSADVTVTSGRIDVTNTTDTATIDLSDGVSLSEAVAIAAADTTGTQTLVLSSAFASQSLALSGALAFGESLTLDADAANNLSLTGAISIASGQTLTLSNGSNDRLTFGSYLSVSGDGGITKTGAGTVGLYANNTYAGNTQVYGGTLQLVDQTSLGLGSTVSLNGGTLSFMSNPTLAKAVVLGSGGGTIAGGGAPITLSGNISGAGVLTLSAAGNYTGVTLTGTNTHARTVITTGTAFVSSSANLGTGSVTLAGGNLSISGSGVDVSNAIVMSNDATITNASGVTLSGLLSGTGTLTKAGGGTLKLANTGNEAALSGGLTVNAGALSLADDDALSSGTLTLSGGGLQITRATTLDNAVVVSAAANIETNFQGHGGVATLAGVLSGSGALSKNGPDTLVLAGANTHTGSFTVTQATLRLEGGSAIGDGSAVTLNANATLALGAAETIGSLASPDIDESEDTPPGLSLEGNTLTLGGNDSSTSFDGVISGSGSVVKTGSGSLSLTGNNTYTGTTTVAAGTLAIGSDANLGSGAVTLADAATLQITGATTLDNDVTLSGDASLQTDADATLSGLLSGSSTLTKTGTGTLTLTHTGNEAAMSGELKLAAGTLAVADDDALSAGTVSLNGGALSITGATTIDNDIVLNLAAVLSNSVDATLSGQLSGDAKLFKQGAGTLTLSNTGNSAAATGDIEVRAGALRVSADENLSSGTVVLNGGTLSLASGAAVDNAVSLGVNGGTLAVDADAMAVLTGAVSGDGTLTKDGEGVLYMVGDNTYTGATLINAGAVLIGTATGLGSAAAGTTVADGATLAVVGDISVAEPLTLSGAGLQGTAGALLLSEATVTGDITLAGDTYIVDTMDSAVTGTLSGAISGGFGLTQVSAGVLTLSGANTYTGATTVSAGTLSVTGSLAGTASVSVAGGATLSGTGSIGTVATSGVVRVDSGGTLAPGVAGAGTLTLNDGVQFETGSIYAADVAGTTPGVGHDQLDVHGAVQLNGGTLTVNTTGLTAASGDTYLLINNDGSDAVEGTFAGLAEGATVVAADGRLLQISYVAGDGNDVALRALNAVPTTLGIGPQTASEDSAYNFTVPGSTFSDADAGDSLTLSATLSSGDALPSWLSFNASTGVFSGTPANGDVGAITVRVTATDGS
ncbi:MAG: autotransporter-associated beta strand repeat-containing protein, partial [Burkholderiales bacterium]